MRYTLPSGLLNRYPITVDKDTGSMTVKDKTWPREEVNEIKNEYKGTNRIHKPIAILFYIDVMGGKVNNYNNVIKTI